MSTQTVNRITLSAPEAAIALGISQRTLWTRTKAGDIPHVRIGGRVLYVPSLLEQFVLDQATRTAPPSKAEE